MALDPTWSGEVALGPVLNQRVYPGNEGTIDDCAPVSANQAARAVGGKLVNILTFRKAVGIMSGGMDRAAVLKGARACWPELDIILSPIAWTDARSRLEAGYVMSVMVMSSKLPQNFGFDGLHQVTLRKVANTIYIANPLAPEGSRAVPISDAAIRIAINATGKVNGVLFAPAHSGGTTAGTNLPPTPPTPPPPPPPVVDCHSQAELNEAYANGRADGISAAKTALENVK